MFVIFPAQAGNETAERAVEVNDIRAITRMRLNKARTVIILDDHNGGREHFPVRLPLEEVVRKVNHAKLYEASFIAADTAAEKAAGA